MDAVRALAQREWAHARAMDRLPNSEISETLHMLEQSYRNLQRAGFREVYDKEIYEWCA